jgi:hypothetical protein
VADPAAIIARIRALGANVILDAGKLRFVNGARLPADAAQFIGKHRDALIAHLQDEVDEVDERAAIIEFDGGVPRDIAMQFARTIAAAKKHIPDAARAAFLDACGRIVDEELPVAA